MTRACLRMLAVGLCAWASACASQPEPSAPAPVAVSPERVDAPIARETAALTWVAALEMGHAATDARLAEGDLSGAERVLRKALATAAPASTPADDLRRAHQDLWFRLAELQLRAGQAASARASVADGLALGRAQDLFTANLLIVDGHALSALGRETEASERYFEALEINRHLLQQALASPTDDAGANSP